MVSTSDVSPSCPSVAVSIEQPGEEAAYRADDRSAQQRDRDERHEQHVGDASEHVDLREDRDLHDRRDEQQRRGLEAVGDRHGSVDAFVGMRAATASIPVSFANGATCTVR